MKLKEYLGLLEKDTEVTVWDEDMKLQRVYRGYNGIEEEKSSLTDLHEIVDMVKINADGSVICTLRNSMYDRFCDKCANIIEDMVDSDLYCYNEVVSIAAEECVESIEQLDNAIVKCIDSPDIMDILIEEYLENVNIEGIVAGVVRDFR